MTGNIKDIIPLEPFRPYSAPEVACFLYKPTGQFWNAAEITRAQSIWSAIHDPEDLPLYAAQGKHTSGAVNIVVLAARAYLEKA